MINVIKRRGKPDIPGLQPHSRRLITIYRLYNQLQLDVKLARLSTSLLHPVLPRTARHADTLTPFDQGDSQKYRRHHPQ